MGTQFLALATSATIFATSIVPVAASEYRYCLQGEEFAGTGDWGFTSDQQCQASASGRMAYCGADPDFATVLINRARPHHR